MMTPGFNILNLGPGGTGKTYTIASLVNSGVNPYVIFTEPGAPALRKALKEKGLPEDSVKWRTIQQTTDSFQALEEMASKLNSMSFDLITKMSDPNRSKYQQFIEFLGCCNNFVDDNGQSWGSVADWGTDRCLIVDTNSGLCNMAMALIVGGKPTRAMADWMVAQNTVMAALDTLTTGVNCHFILNAHIERETDEVSGGIMLMASALGKKMAPKLPRNFDEVILSRRDGDKFFWSTTAHNTDLKARLFPLSENIAPDYGQYVQMWKDLGGVITPTVTA